MKHIDEQPLRVDHEQEQDDRTGISHDSLRDDPASDHAQVDDHAGYETADSHHVTTTGAHHHAGHHGNGHHSAHESHEHANYHGANSTKDTAHAKTAPTPQKLFGTEANDTLCGSAKADLIAGDGGDDRLFGHAVNDDLVGSDQGRDAIFGGSGSDTLHGFFAQHEPGNLSFAVEDQQADHLHDGLGKDALFLGSDDVGTGGQGADQFHLSWDVEHGHPAQITDNNPAQDKTYVEFTTHHADAEMTHVKPEETAVTTQALKDGSGTEILINDQSIAHVLGATNLQPADIGLVHA